MLCDSLLVVFFYNDFPLAAGQDGHDGHDEAALYRAVVRFLTNCFRASGEAILGTQRYSAI